MTDKTHLFFGITTAAIAVSTLYSSAHPALFIGLSAIGSSFPNLDDLDSIPTKYFPTVSLVIRRLNGCGRINVNVHRKYTHDILLVTIIGIISVLLFPITAGFFFGYMGHLLLDSMTDFGIPWGYKFYDHLKDYKCSFRYGTFHLLPRRMMIGSQSKASTVLAFFCIILFGIFSYHFGTGFLAGRFDTGFLTDIFTRATVGEARIPLL